MKINISKVKIFLKKVAVSLTRHPFLSCFGCILLAGALGVILFYKYAILSQDLRSETKEAPFSLEEETHREILKIWEQQKTRFNQADLKEYPDPFKVFIIENSEPESP